MNAFKSHWPRAANSPAASSAVTRAVDAGAAPAVRRGLGGGEPRVPWKGDARGLEVQEHQREPPEPDRTREVGVGQLAAERVRRTVGAADADAVDRNRLHETTSPT